MVVAALHVTFSLILCILPLPSPAPLFVEMSVGRNYKFSSALIKSCVLHLSLLPLLIWSTWTLNHAISLRSEGANLPSVLVKY